MKHLHNPLVSPVSPSTLAGLDAPCPWTVTSPTPLSLLRSGAIPSA